MIINITEEENHPIILLVSPEESLWQFDVSPEVAKRWADTQKSFYECQEEMGKLIRDSYEKGIYK